MDSLGEDSSDNDSFQGTKRSKNSIKNNLKKVKYSNIGDEPRKKGKKNSELYKAPTAEELNNYKEVENLYNNNFFRLQISELIKGVGIKNKRKTNFNDWYEKFKQSMQSLPILEDFTLGQIRAISKKKLTKTEKCINSLSKYPCYLKTDQDLTLKLSKPEAYECFGLHEVNSSPGPCLNINVRVNMPRSYFNVKDFSNNRYLVKRFYYLLYILENVEAVKKSLVLHEDIPLLPVLKLQPTEDDKIALNVYVVPPENYFKSSRFLPNINNVKCDVFTGSIEQDLLQETPTILYNTALAYDVTLQSNADYLKTVLNDCPNVQEGIKLLLVWLKQRELDVGFGGLKETLLVSLVVFLVGIKKINKLMSAYQVVRRVWSFLADTNLTSFPICMGDCSNETMELFRANFSVVFLDCTGSYNLAAFLTANMVRKISSECRVALEQLDSGSMESFRLLFLMKCPFSLQYDMVLDISTALPLSTLKTPVEEQAILVGFEFVSRINYLSEMIKQSLNERVINIVPRIETQYSTESDKYTTKLLLGINLNPDKAFNIIEKGPTLSDHIEAEKFRQFWGELSSDRRFKDGSTHVAVYFENVNTIRARRNIIKRIVKYFLNDKLRLKSKVHYDDLEEFIINKRLKAPYSVGTCEEPSGKAVGLSDELGRIIRNLPTSIMISGASGLSDTLCHTDPCPPIASKFEQDEKKDRVQRYLKPIQSVLYLEASSKWPSDLQGVRYLKTAILLEIRALLKKTNDIQADVSRDCLYVHYKGLVFKYFIYVSKEIALMKKEEGFMYDNAPEIERDLTILPKVIGSLGGLQYRYPSFGASSCLIKKWIRSQMIDNSHMTDVQIDLLNAAQHLRDAPYLMAATPQVAFLRFLQYIKELQWDLHPVIVNFNELLSKEDILELESKFQKNRESLQPLYILMPHDKGQSLFTKNSPSKEILTRLQQLADTSLRLLLDKFSGNADFDLYSLFTPNMDGYDLIISIDADKNSRRYESVGSNKDGQVILKPYVQKPHAYVPLIGFSPVDFYLQKLRENYGEYATFFHNSYGGNKIGVLWNPLPKETNEFSVKNVHGKKLVEHKLVLNTDVFIEDFYLMGKDIVTWIEKK